MIAKPAESPAPKLVTIAITIAVTQQSPADGKASTITNEVFVEAPTVEAALSPEDVQETPAAEAVMNDNNWGKTLPLMKGVEV